MKAYAILWLSSYSLVTANSSDMISESRNQISLRVCEIPGTSFVQCSSNTMLFSRKGELEFSCESLNMSNISPHFSAFVPEAKGTAVTRQSLSTNIYGSESTRPTKW